MRFFLLAYLAVMAFDLPFLGQTRAGGAASLAFGLAVWSTYPLLYLAPVVLATTLAGLPALGRGRTARAAAVAAQAVAVLGTAAVLGFLLVDARVHEIYGFHVNGFVLNLVGTPGGIESMGAGPSTYRTSAWLALGVLALPCALLALARAGWPPVRPRLAVLAGLWFALSAAERVGYGAAHVAGNTPVLAAADAFPLYSRLTFDRLAQRLGFEVRREPGVAVELGGAGLAYPLAPLEIVAPERPLNVVWLVAESLRADALEPGIMPRTSEFARGARTFARHYSGGNGTRMGVFGQLYGLHGTYWFPALESRRGPVLIDALRAQGYRFSANTSARFTYPEFDSTVFAALDAAELHEWSEGESWERDRAMVGGVLSFLDEPDPAPFFVFAFFESPHARYLFPEECAVRRPYLADLDYAALDLERDVEGIRNRYLNSCRHLDTQLARLVDGLAARDLLGRTIVVITGDHGEEFLEHGRWGHGSSFVEEQVRVPLVLSIPGVAPGVEQRMTSHLDLPATLLPRLGVRNSPPELSLGHDLLGPLEHTHVVVADWSRLCVITPDLAATFATKATSLFRGETTDLGGRPVKGAEIPVEVLADVLEGLGRFRARSGPRPRVAPAEPGRRSP